MKTRAMTLERFSSPARRLSVDLEFARGPHLHGAERSGGEAGCDVARLLHVAGLDHVKAGNHFLRFGKRAVDDGGGAIPYAKTGRGIRRVERFGDQKVAARPERV